MRPARPVSFLSLSLSPRPSYGRPEKPRTCSPTRGVEPAAGATRRNQARFCREVLPEFLLNSPRLASLTVPALMLETAEERKKRKKKRKRVEFIRVFNVRLNGSKDADIK